MPHYVYVLFALFCMVIKMNDYIKFKTALLFDHVPPFLSFDFPLLEQCKIDLQID